MLLLVLSEARPSAPAQAPHSLVSTRQCEVIAVSRAAARHVTQRGAWGRFALRLGDLGLPRQCGRREARAGIILWV